MERKTKIHAADGKQELTITRAFDLPVSLLFKAYTEPDILEQWMGTKVVQFQNKQHGSYRFETSDDKGNIMFTAHGTIHDVIIDRRIVRTFEMDNADFDVQLEFLQFESLTESTSQLIMQIIYRSHEHRERQLKLPFAFGINMAHNRLQDIVSKIKVMPNTNPKVEFYFSKESKWQKALQHLRDIALDCGLDEVLKWGCPCYTFQGANVVLIHEFKDYCAYLIFKGVLLQDPEGILVQQTKNVQAARQIRFTNAQQISRQKKILKAYIYEAIAAEQAGLQVKMKKTKEFEMPDEFEQKLKEKPALKKAFEALTPGRQRGYLLYFAQAKQSKTRVSRIEKSEADIMQGKGFND